MSQSTKGKLRRKMVCLVFLLACLGVLGTAPASPALADDWGYSECGQPYWKTQVDCSFWIFCTNNAYACADCKEGTYCVLLGPMLDN